MTRKHFEALALALSNSKPTRDDHKGYISPTLSHHHAELQWRADVRAVASVLLPHNPSFDARFYTACDYETTEEATP